jgi:hypothetical protein
MIPAQLARQFRAPKKMEKDFLNYLAAAKLTINQSKSIASIAYYHQLLIDTAPTLNFFTGTLTPEDTNLNEFVRPESEHAVIYGIRIAVGDGSTPLASTQPYTPGTGNNAAIENSTITVTNNNVVVLEDYPLTEALESLTTKDDGLILLDENIIWAGQTSLSIRWTSKSAVSETTNLPLRITLVGIGLI